MHLRFEPELIEEKAEKQVLRVKVKKMQGICCGSSGTSAALFSAPMMM
jgi:hypothetical protein